MNPNNKQPPVGDALLRELRAKAGSYDGHTHTTVSDGHETLLGLTCMAAAAGIVVAVYVQAMYGMLRVRLDHLTADLEAAASQILGILAAHREVGA